MWQQGYGDSGIGVMVKDTVGILYQLFVQKKVILLLVDYLQKYKENPKLTWLSLGMLMQLNSGLILITF